MSNRYIDCKYLLLKSSLLTNKTILNNDKSKIIKELIDNLDQKNINESINLSIELHLSGYFDSLLTKLSDFYLNNINLSQPLGIIYLTDITTYYNSKYVYKIKKKHPLKIINDIKLRNFVCFFIPLCCLSIQRKIPKLIKIKDEDFNLKNKKNKLISKDLNLLYKYIKKKDPKDIMIPLSEIINLLYDDRIDKEHLIIFWISWLYECEVKFHNKSLITDYRHVSELDKKYCNDFIWILWDMLLNVSNDNKYLVIKCYDLFKNKYTKSAKKKKANILINAVLICVSNLSKTNSHKYIEDNVINICNSESLNSNTYYWKLINKII
tara:strand:- start:258 stop:1226 length:969 start_codon:yes stop_codon:yes gene_type:complete